MLVGDWEELVETTLQEVVLPLNQEGPDTPHSSSAHTPIGSPPHSPPRLMAGVNANPPPNPPNPPPSWRARSSLNLTPPLHDCYPPKWHLSVRVPTFLMLVHKRTSMD